MGKNSLGKKKKEKQMKPRIRTILSHAIERGIEYGWNRAHKNTDSPAPERIRESIETEIWNEVDEIMEFDPEVLS